MCEKNIIISKQASSGLLGLILRKDLEFSSLFGDMY